MNSNLQLQVGADESSAHSVTLISMLGGASGIGVAALVAVGPTVSADVAGYRWISEYQQQFVEGETGNASWALNVGDPSWVDTRYLLPLTDTDFGLLAEIERVGRSMGENAIQLSPDLRDVLVETRKENYL